MPSTASNASGSHVAAAKAGENQDASPSMKPERTNVSAATTLAAVPSAMRRANAYVNSAAATRCPTITASSAIGAGRNRKKTFPGYSTPYSPVARNG